MFTIRDAWLSRRVMRFTQHYVDKCIRFVHSENTHRVWQSVHADPLRSGYLFIYLKLA